MRVTRQQFLQIQTALLDGYDRTGLRRLVRLGLDVSLDDITIGTTDSAVVFDLIEWAERCDKIQALIQAAVEQNNQNAGLRQLQQDAAAWFAPSGHTPQSAAQLGASPPAVAPPANSAGGDIIIAHIGSGSQDISVGKNINQSADGSSKPKRESTI